MAPLVTVCVPVYNGEKYLVRCLDSLLSQSFRDFKLLISDNASVDSTSAIARRYADGDPRVEYWRQERNIGLYGNFSYLLTRVDTKYCKIANADDWWAPDMIGDAVDVLEGNPELVLCYPKMIMVDAAGRETSRYDDQFEAMQDRAVDRFTFALLNLRFVNQLAGVMRTAAVRSVLPLMIQPGSDAVMVAELCLYGKIALLDKYQYFRRFHEESSSHDRKSREHQRKFVGAGGAQVSRFERWRHHLGLMRRLVRSPVGIRGHASGLWFLLRRMNWDRRALYAELWR